MSTHFRFVVIAECFPFGSLAGAQEQSWKGEKVDPAKRAEEIELVANLDSNFPYFGLAPNIVRDEKEDFIRIHDGHREGWAKKSDFIQLRKARVYYDGPILGFLGLVRARLERGT
jgi:hypothetical protein